LYLWSIGGNETQNTASVRPVVANDARPAVPAGRLNELALLVDTGGTYQAVTAFKDIPPIPDDHAAKT